MHFEATEENKLIYMDIFKKYNENIESFITLVSSLEVNLFMQRLTEECENFKMEHFLAQVEERKDQIDE